MPDTTVLAPATTARRPRRAAVRTGWVLTALFSAFLAVDGVAHLVRPAPVVEATERLGFPPESAIVMGVVQLLCLALHLLRPTTVLGAVLLTGYLGGAVTAHLRVEDPLLSATLFPIYMGTLMWVGLWLREPAVRTQLPLARTRAAA
ncbi:DoxX-like protein [Kineococcus xinjiangensis]|uniref:DoxX-like protein n=1 Tax=Kineococcus xinjiangensis TaxID=512762 RepID=A0A2S6IE49_9ACTN|nr:DoxX family protein [Kineococcus xinjiangensis]PPK92463.1 DoxX-like protein [Kineococcus xinjiangensis]